MRPPKNKWPTSPEGRCVLLCAQLLQEMLGEFTFESFRVYSLGTVSRLNEAVALIDDIQRSRIPREALTPILDEMLWSFDKDPVAKQAAHLEIAALAELAKQQKSSLPDLVASIRLISRLLSWGYKVALEQRLLELFNEPRRKIELRQACGFYCSHLVNVGFSKQWIGELVEETFFEADMSSADRRTLAGFFTRFHEDPVDFVIHTSIGSELARFLPPLGYEVGGLNDQEASISDALKPNAEIGLTHVLTSKVQAYDPYGAIDAVQQQLTSIRALTYLGREATTCRWSERMHVRRKQDSVGRVLLTSALSFEKPSETTTSGHRLKDQRNYVKRVFENFDSPSLERLLSSINTAALARTSPNRENQLISLWSAVEVLLSDPPTNTPRILNYVHQLVPCICLRHVRRQFVAVFEELLVSYRRSFASILRREDQFANQDPHTNFAAAVCLDENKALREDLCELCKDNPLALQRLFKLQRDYSSLGAAAGAIESHENRVRWQVHRIYRARNQLVHSGQVPSYLDSLILNLAEYYRGSIATIVNRARKDPDESDVDQVVSEIGIEYSILTRQFSKSNKARLQRADLYRLVST